METGVRVNSPQSSVHRKHFEQLEHIEQIPHGRSDQNSKGRQDFRKSEKQKGQALDYGICSLPDDQ